MSKYCKKTQEYAIHNCNKKEKGNFIVVFDKNNKDAIKFIICKNCRKSYYIDLFLNYCQNCNCNYYCGLMGPKEDPNFLPATFNPPHCELIANDKIQCTKCKGAFYYNMKENYLQCINNSCKYKISPNLANFKCNICSTYFRTDIKIYNNFELIYIRKIISISLLIKEKANPGILPCCKNLELNDLVFYHKKECRGSLYFWILNKKIIVICEKCKAINYFSRFIWTCPNCGLHFKTKKEEIEEKLKKNLFNNLKSKLDINILLGDEILESHYLLQHNYSQIKLKADLKRKKPLREILEKKRKGLYKNDYKEKLRNKKISYAKVVTKCYSTFKDTRPHIGLYSPVSITQLLGQLDIRVFKVNLGTDKISGFCTRLFDINLDSEIPDAVIVINELYCNTPEKYLHELLC